MKKLTVPFVLFGRPIFDPNIRYITHFSAQDSVAVILLPEDHACCCGDHRIAEKVCLLVPAFEFHRAQVQAKDCHVADLSRLEIPSELRDTLGVGLWRLLTNFDFHEIQVDPWFPTELARFLEKNGVKTTVSHENPILEMRRIKTPDEIKKIAHVQRITRLAMNTIGRVITQAGVDSKGRLIHEGKVLTSEIAHRIVRNKLLEYDCLDEETIIAGGDQAVDPHERGHGPLKTGEYIVCDIFPKSLITGYWGDMTRTFIHGKPSREMAKAYRTVKQAQTRAIEAVQIGTPCHAVHSLVKAFFQEAGYSTGITRQGRLYGFTHGTGHGVGLEIHENPSLNLSTLHGPLLENMVVTVEPGLYYPSQFGIRIEDLVVVTQNGAKIL